MKLTVAPSIPVYSHETQTWALHCRQGVEILLVEAENQTSSKVAAQKGNQGEAAQMSGATKPIWLRILHLKSGFVFMYARQVCSLRVSQILCEREKFAALF